MIRDPSSTPAVPGGLPFDATQISFLQAGAGAVPRILQNKERDIISVADFGMLPSASAATNTAALALIATAVNALGGATILIPPGTYNVNGRTDDGALCAFSSLAGLTISAGGATIADQTTYTGTQQGLLFKFTDCSNYSVTGLKITTQNVGVNLRGLHAFYSTGTCKDFELDWEQTGGFIGCNLVRAFADPVASRCSCYKIRAKLTNVHYGIAGQFSGDNGQVQLDAEGSFRDFIFYGAAHVAFDINSKNPNGTSLIQSFQGLGCSDITLNLHDRESTSHIDLTRVSVSWGDQTAATHRDIRLHFDIANVAGSAGVSFFNFSKLTNAGAADTTGRGHQLLGFEISGNSDTIAGCNHVGVDGSLMALTGTPDVVKNLKVKDFICTGATVDDDWSFLAGVLTDTMVFDHVNVGARSLVVANGANGKVFFKDCVAATFNVNRQNGGLPFGDTGGAVVVLDKKTAAASASISFTTGISADFSEYAIPYADLVPAVDNGFLYLEVSQDSGATWKQGATDYTHSNNILSSVGTNTPGGGAATDNKIICGPSISNDAGASCSGEIVFTNPAGTTLNKMFRNVAACRSTLPAAIYFSGSGYLSLNTAAITGVRITCSSGSLASGTFSLVGRR